MPAAAEAVAAAAEGEAMPSWTSTCRSWDSSEEAEMAGSEAAAPAGGGGGGGGGRRFRHLRTEGGRILCYAGSECTLHEKQKERVLLELIVSCNAFWLYNAKLFLLSLFSNGNNPFLKFFFFLFRFCRKKEMGIFHEEEEEGEW